MTKQEYSHVLQTLAEDERSAGLIIKAQRWAENQLAAILFLKNGHRAIFITSAEFNRWYGQQHVHKRIRNGVPDHSSR
jgi:hypothetical protein